MVTSTRGAPVSTSGQYGGWRDKW